MTLKFLTYILLPANLTVNPDGFDHASISEKYHRLYVAHTANDSVEIIDTVKDAHLTTVKGLKGVAGALVSDEKNLVFTSNRGDNSVGIFSPDGTGKTEMVSVGNGPNGVAFDPASNLLAVGNTGKSPTISVIDVNKREMVANLPVPSRTRWTIFDPTTRNFYVNVKEPAQIAVIGSEDPSRIKSIIELPEKGPHGLDIDTKTGRLFCACDSKKLLVIDTKTQKVTSQRDISGAPDVIFFNPELKRLYVTIEDPGVVDVFDTSTMKRIGVVKTEAGAHTMAFEPKTNKVYVFLPKTHRVAVYSDSDARTLE